MAADKKTKGSFTLDRSRAELSAAKITIKLQRYQNCKRSNVLGMQNFDFCPNLIKLYSNFSKFTQILPKLFYRNLPKFYPRFPKKYPQLLRHWQLIPSYCVGTLHKALICFTEHILKRIENEALLRFASCKCDRTLTQQSLRSFLEPAYSHFTLSMFQNKIQFSSV